MQWGTLTAGGAVVGGVVGFSVLGCSHPTSRTFLVGDFVLVSANHGRPVYKKTVQVQGCDVLAYFWDERDGPNMSGWWFGHQVGADSVWAYNPNRAEVPPQTGWQVPFGGAVDTQMALHYSSETEAVSQPMLVQMLKRPADAISNHPSPEQPRSMSLQDSCLATDAPVSAAACSPFANAAGQTALPVAHGEVPVQQPASMVATLNAVPCSLVAHVLMGACRTISTQQPSAMGDTLQAAACHPTANAATNAALLEAHSATAVRQPAAVAAALRAAASVNALRGANGATHPQRPPRAEGKPANPHGLSLLAVQATGSGAGRPAPAPAQRASPAAPAPEQQAPRFTPWGFSMPPFGVPPSMMPPFGVPPSMMPSFGQHLLFGKGVAREDKWRRSRSRSFRRGDRRGTPHGRVRPNEWAQPNETDNDRELASPATDLGPSSANVEQVRRVLMSLGTHVEGEGEEASGRGIFGRRGLPPGKLTPVGEARATLISMVFERLDIDADEALGPREMRRFAELTGFKGSEAEWRVAYQALLCENGRNPEDPLALDLMLFAKLVEDTSADTGCHCTDVELKIILEKLPKPGEAAPSGVSRLDLIMALFKKLDEDCDGTLGAREMRKFAEQTGFDGGDDAWAKEYRRLCTETSSEDNMSMLDLAYFSKLVNDRSEDSGCYCNDDDLYSMLVRLGGSIGSTPPLPKIGPETLVPMSTYRSSLVRHIFDRLDVDRDGKLKQNEMKVFAGYTGFTCNDVMVWAQEFKQLCVVNGINPEDGVDYVVFCKLVNDQSEDAGLYCTDPELQIMLKRLGGPYVKRTLYAGSASPASQLATENARETGSIAKQTTKAPAAATGFSVAEAALPAYRIALVRSVFQAFDMDKDGLLNKEEMRAFAESTGFDGGDSAWDEAYKVLCREKKKDPRCGVDLKVFSVMVNTKDDSAGCYCTDSELSAAMAKASKLAADMKARSTAKAAAVTALPAPTALTWGDLPRGKLIEALFNGLDTNKDGKLSSSEMREFAVLTGFKGCDDDWAEAYKGLCADAGGGDTVDIRGFNVLVNDPSEDLGCHCTDTDLRGMLEKLKVPPPVMHSAVPKARSNASLLTLPPVPSRSELIRAVFKKLDLDRDGKLNPKEMRRFAEMQDFEGTDAEWVKAYEELCTEKCRDPSQGVDLGLFTQLVNDESEDAGCHCTDAEMRTMLIKL